MGEIMPAGHATHADVDAEKYELVLHVAAVAEIGRAHV